MTVRLDVALASRGLARSRNQGAQLIAAGRVQVNGETVTRPATLVAAEAHIDVTQQPWVSRAAHKLLGALEQSGTQVPARVLDAGASTGGFTQVCLQAGATEVYAVDVGHGQLAPELRADPRVHVRERLNLRDLSLSDLDDQPVQLVVGDVSFISLRLLLAPLFQVLSDDGIALLLVKPQFEVGRDHIGAGGVVKDTAARDAAVRRVIAEADALGWHCDFQAESVLPGSGGNLEYFVRFAS